MLSFPETYKQNSQEHTDLTEVFQTMIAAVDETTKHFRGDLGHDLAIIMRQPRTVFLWMVYDMGTQICPIDNLELMGVVLNQYQTEHTARWFHLDLIANKATEFKSASPWEQYHKEATSRYVL